jgi:hypothetical protein
MGRTQRTDKVVHPDRASLSEAFGFTVPDAFVEFIRVLSEQCDDNQDYAELFMTLTGQYLVGVEVCYSQTPPEMFPIASMRVDGVHYGYIIHAPELPARDYPVGYLCPMDADGVSLVGFSTLEAIETLASRQIDHGSSYAGDILRISQVLGIKPSKEKANRCYDRFGNGLPVLPRKPAGWRFILSEDGVGVLAPSDAFRAGPHLALDDDAPAEAYLRLADQTSAAGFPATALLYLRDGYWRHWTDDDIALEICNRLIRVYDALGRASLTEAVRLRMDRLDWRRREEERARVRLNRRKIARGIAVGEREDGSETC